MKTSTFIAEAFETLSNCGGVSIQIHEDGETIRYQWNNEKPSKWCKIRYNKQGEPFFNIAGRRHYLNNFYRIVF